MYGGGLNSSGVYQSRFSKSMPMIVGSVSKSCSSDGTVDIQSRSAVSVIAWHASADEESSVRSRSGTKAPLRQMTG